jgi:DedD protein
MSTSPDTEITLGTGKMLVLFFGLVIVCAVFFGIGFSLGKNAGRTTTLAGEISSAATASSPAVLPSAGRPVNAPVSSSADQGTSVQASEAKDEGQAPKVVESAAQTPVPQTVAAKTTSPDPMAPFSLNGYYVQVAAVSKQEDAEALVGALKKKQYAAFSVNNSASDKLFHVQIGPFSDIKEAETTRAKLISDGYNPILKK